MAAGTSVPDNAALPAEKCAWICADVKYQSTVYAAQLPCGVFVPVMRSLPKAGSHGMGDARSLVDAWLRAAGACSIKQPSTNRGQI